MSISQISDKDTCLPSISIFSTYLLSTSKPQTIPYEHILHLSCLYVQTSWEMAGKRKIQTFTLITAINRQNKREMMMVMKIVEYR
jgi:hypothetical protein